jgi:hypothetical protein
MRGKKTKIEKLTDYYISFNADYHVYCRYINDIELIKNFSDNSKQNLSGAINFMLRQFEDSFIIKLSKLIEATLKTCNNEIQQISDENHYKDITHKVIECLKDKYKKSDLKKIRNKIVAHLDDDFLKENQKISEDYAHYLISKSEEYKILLDLTGKLLNSLHLALYGYENFYHERVLDIANQLIPLLISGYKNFHFAGKSIKNDIYFDKNLENYKLNIEKTSESISNFKNETK